MEENKNTELVKIDPAQYGLQATEAAQVEAVFLPMIAKMKELEDEFNEVVNMPIEPTTIAKAKELRLKYVKVRTGTAAIHKTAKDYYLKGGRFVDGWKNAQAFASQEKEQALEKIEKHFEILEAERKAKLKAERLIKIAGLTENPEMYPLSEMSEAAFDQLLTGLELAKKQKEEAEKAAEAERLEKIRLEAERIEKIRLENEKLKEAQKAKEIQDAKRNQELRPYIVFIRDYTKMLNMPESDYQKELADIKKGAELQWEFDRTEQIRKQKEQDDKDEQIRLEKIKSDKLQKELKEKQDAENAEKLKAEAEAKAKELEAKKAAKQPDKEKLLSWVAGIKPTIDISLKSKEATDLCDEIIGKFAGFQKWAKSEIEKL